MEIIIIIKSADGSQFVDRLSMCIVLYIYIYQLLQRYFFSTYTCVCGIVCSMGFKLQLLFSGVIFCMHSLSCLLIHLETQLHCVRSIYRHQAKLPLFLPFNHLQNASHNIAAVQHSTYFTFNCGEPTLIHTNAIWFSILIGLIHSILTRIQIGFLFFFQSRDV